MDLAVTVGAAAVKEKHRSRRPRADRVTRCVVALSAEPRICDLEKPVIDGSVRLMAVAAILKRRRMFPQKRPAPLGVTGVTVFIDAGLFELGRIGGAVRIVAIGAGELAFSQGHMGRAHELGFSLQVALAANFCFRPLIEKWRLLADLRRADTCRWSFPSTVWQVTQVSPRFAWGLASQ